MIQEEYMDDTLQEALRQAKDKAESATRIKNIFLSTMSHEFRTPLSIIMGLTDHLKTFPLAEEQVKIVDDILQASTRLSQLFDDLLKYSELVAGGVALRTAPFVATALLESLVTKMTVERAREKGITLSSWVAEDVPEILEGDVQHIREILEKLLDNALKFTPSGYVTLRMERDHTESSTMVERIVFSITDTGIGIPPDKQKTIFDSFTQADSSHTRQYQGAGLGLTICSRLVEQLHGRIHLESTPERGSTFKVSLPLRLAKR